MADVKKFIKGVVDLPSHLKEAVESAHAPKVFYSTAGRLADKISEANPKMSEYEVMRRAFDQSTKKLDWERVDKPALEKTYGDLGGSTFTDSKVKRMRNTPAVVEERKRAANEFLDQPTEPWVPPKPELQAFDRSSIKDALEGFPDVPQSVFPRDIPPRASTKHVDELYTDPANRDLIKKQIMRGLPLGGESFYASLYPVKQAVLEAGMPASKFDSWVHSMAPASARNSIMNEMAVGQFLRNLHSQGIPLTAENVKREMAAFKEQFGIGLPLFDGHRLGVANVLENNLNLRDLSQANIPTNYKIPTYGAQKTGDFAHSATLDVHEAAGQTQGSRYHPYFTEAGGFGNTEYNAGEQGFLGIAKELGLPGGMAQAGRWFGGGELTGLKSPRGDALDLLEKQFAFSLLHQGRQPNPANIRSEVLKQIETGEGMLLPWYRKEGMPDVRTTGLQRKDGGQVEHMQAGGVKKAIGALGELAQAAPKKVTHGMLRRHGMEIGNKEEADALYSSGHRIFGMHELDEVPFEITDRKLFDSYAPDMMLAYPPEKPLLKADGGSVEHMQAGGMMGLVNEFKALQAAHNAARLAKTTRNIPPVQDMVISQAEKEANLARYLENAAVKDRMYHATGDDFSVVDVDKSDPRSKFGTGFYMTPNTNYANFFANMRMKEGKPSQVMPVYTSVKNPYEISGTQNIPLTGIDREKLKALGHDGVLFRNDAGNVQEVVAFDPTQVKSAIGNRGTYDPTEVEMTKAEGGAVHSQAEDGDIMRQLFDHALDKGDIHEMTHAMLVKQHEAEYG